MPDLTVYNYIDGHSGYSSSFGSTPWASTRDATSGAAPQLSMSNSQYGSGIVQISGTILIIYRSLFVFDTSGISVAPSAASFKVYTKTRNSGDCRIVKCTHYSDASVTTADYDAITGFSAGNSMAGNVTDYSSNVSSWASDGNVNTMTLNSTALSDMASLSLFQILVVNTTYDYLNVAPSGTVYHACGMYYSNNSGTSLDPYIEYTAGASGYAHDVNGVATGNIGKIKALASTSIEKVIGK